MWMDGLDVSSSGVIAQLVFVLGYEDVIMHGLTEPDQETLKSFVQRSGMRFPFAVRSYFSKFGSSMTKSTITQVELPVSVEQVSDTESERIRALACLEIRSIILKHPKGASSLLPLDWSKRFNRHLGSYRNFIALNTPSLFNMEINKNTGISMVGLSGSSGEAFGALQRLIDKSGKPNIEEHPFSEPDEQYIKISQISDIIDKYRICGSKVTFDEAKSRLRTLMRQNMTGCALSKARRALSDAGIPPIPLEWFSDLFVIIHEDDVYLRKVRTETRGAVDDGLVVQCGTIIRESIARGIPFVKIQELVSKTGKSQTDLLQTVQRAGTFLYTPDMIYPCDHFEEKIEGYLSPNTIAKYHRDVELASLSPFQHLIHSIERQIGLNEDSRLRSEFVLACSAALDVKPRLLWQCLKAKVFWSCPESDLQVLLRTKVGRAKHSNPYSPNEFPSDLAQSIKTEVKDLGAMCTLDRLTSMLHWGKQSENAKKFGPLRSVLSRMPDIFYDPFYIYSRAAIDELVQWPDEPEDMKSECVKLIEASNLNFINSATFAASMAYYLTTSGYQYYPLHQAQEALVQAGLGESEVFRYSQLFVPSDIIYLRKSATAEIELPKGSIEWTIVNAIERAGRKAIQFDNLMKALISSKRFEMEDIDRVRTDLSVSCKDMYQTSGSPSSLSNSCFYNPSVIVLRQHAIEHLATEISDIKYPELENFKIRPLLEIEETNQDDDHDILVVDLPKWCIKDSIVKKMGDDFQEEFGITNIDGANIYIQKLSDGESMETVGFDTLIPRQVRVSDKVLVLNGVYRDSTFRVVGISGPDASVQVSKFEFKSIPVKDLVCIR